MEEEIWKDIIGYEGLYKVSNLGNIKTLNWERSGIQKILKPRNNTRGYTSVDLYKNGIHKQFMIHRIVANAFIDNPHGYPCVNHKNEIKNDNRASNLEWCTYSYNNTYNNKQKRVIKSKRERGYPSGGKAVLQLSLDGKIINRYDSMLGAEKILGIRHISECCSNSNKTAGGFRWCYAYEPIHFTNNQTTTPSTQ